MDHTYKVQVSEQEANKVKSLTGRSNVSDAIVDLLTLAGRGRLQVRPRGAAQWRSAREKALKNYHPSPEAIRGALRSIAELRGKKINVSKSQRKSSRARNPGA